MNIYCKRRKSSGTSRKIQVYGKCCNARRMIQRGNKNEDCNCSDHFQKSKAPYHKKLFIAKAEEEIYQVLCMVCINVWLPSLDIIKRYGDKNSGSINVVSWNDEDIVEGQSE